MFSKKKKSHKRMGVFSPEISKLIIKMFFKNFPLFSWFLYGKFIMWCMKWEHSSWWLFCNSFGFPILRDALSVHLWVCSGRHKGKSWCSTWRKGQQVLAVFADVLVSQGFWCQHCQPEYPEVQVNVPLKPACAPLCAAGAGAELTARVLLVLSSSQVLRPYLWQVWAVWHPPTGSGFSSLSHWAVSSASFGSPEQPTCLLHAQSHTHSYLPQLLLRVIQGTCM